MKKAFNFVIVCAIAIGLMSTGALATSLDTTSTNYLGLVNPGIPTNPDNQVIYINTLLAQPLGSGPTIIGSEDYTRSNNTCPGGCPTAVVAGYYKEDADETPGFDNTIDVSGFTYLIGKYNASSAGSLVFYVAGLSEVTIPSKLNNKGLSNITLYNPHSVSDGGMTLILLGGALVGLETLRRRKIRV